MLVTCGLFAASLASFFTGVKIKCVDTKAITAHNTIHKMKKYRRIGNDFAKILQSVSVNIAIRTKNCPSKFLQKYTIFLPSVELPRTAKPSSSKMASFISDLSEWFSKSSSAILSASTLPCASINVTLAPFNFSEKAAAFCSFKSSKFKVSSKLFI